MFNAAVSAENAGPFGNNEVSIDGNGGAVNSNHDAIDANQVFSESTQRAMLGHEASIRRNEAALYGKNLAIDGCEDTSRATKTRPKA